MFAVAPLILHLASVVKAISTECTLAWYAALRGRKDLSCPLNKTRVDSRINNSPGKGRVPRGIQWIIASLGPLVLPLLPTLQHRKGAKVQNWTSH